MEKKNLFEIIPESNFHFGLPDEIYSSSNYEDHIKGLTLITDGFLNLDEHNGGEDTEELFYLKPTINGTQYSHAIQAQHGFVNPHGLADVMNYLLAKEKYTGEKKFYVLDLAEYDFSMGFITKNQYSELEQSGLLVNTDSY